MKRDDIITELLAIRARVDEMLVKLREGPDEPPKPEPTYMKLGEFCERWSISRTTLYDYIAEGLPALGERHTRRIKVKDGDDWMARRTGREAA